ncbi:NADP-dependent oxidoreductase [Reinekea sp.]|jgi:NADPH-dependent curcumin reductase CurA|uniref:NADP-dependent oxidoreductase n=1 Tax=Reinekea sp. TaxID=1970455 RepID=UPI002A7F92C9|nr:NADP-dependent oxidoreductase [Reinekea sp.]
MSTYTAINLVKRPDGTAIGPDLFDVVQLQTPAVGPDELLIKQTHMSLDPAMLGWMSPATDSYIPPVDLGSVMRSFGFGVVLESNHPNFAAGDRVQGMFGWQEQVLSSGVGLTKIDANLSAELVLSVLALPGLTATQGLYRIGQPKAGETLVVSGAAGSVGSIVGQLAKAEGLRVIGVAGGAEKCAWLVDELGFDGAVDYKAGHVAEQLAALTPDGIDIYFENTGGEIQNLVFARMNAHGRIAVCGHIADYLTSTPAAGPNWMNIIKKRLTIQGFTMPDHFQDTPVLLGLLMPHLMAGKIKYRAHVLDGLESAMTGLNLFFNGANEGKLIVRL